VKSFNNAKKEMPKHFLPFDLIKTTPFDKEPKKDTSQKLESVRIVVMNGTRFP